MKIVKCQSANEVAKQVLAQFELRALAKRTPLLAFTPTGQTPRPFYKLLTANKKFWASHLIPIQIDEFVTKERIFYRELETQLLRPLSLDVSKTGYFWSPHMNDAEVGDHIAEVLRQEIDIALLGLGPNGHVGFHEPGTRDRYFLGGRVVITDESRKRVPDANTREALTFGAGSFLKAKEIIVMVTGDEKKEILLKVINSEVSGLIPATLLKSHSNLSIFTDIKF